MSTFNESLLALTEDVAAIDHVLAGLADDVWSRPTRLPGWDVSILVAHLSSAIAVMVPGNSPPPTPGPRDPAAAARRIDERAREAAAGQTPLSLRHKLAESTVQALASALRLGPDGTITIYMGDVTIGSFLPSRVVESCVHHLDLLAAVSQDATVPPTAIAITAQALEARLDGQRPADLRDDIAFIEAASGRKAYADPRFPLMT